VTEPQTGSGTLTAWIEALKRHLPRRAPVVLLGLVLLLVPTVAVVRWLTRPKVEELRSATEGETVSLGEKATRQAGIGTAEVRSVVSAGTFDAPAVLALDEARTARIGAVVEGNVVRVLAEVGDRVEAGQHLAEMHSHVVHDAWADYRKGIAERSRRETELAYATAAAERAGRLYAAKAISLQEKQRAEADRSQAEQGLDQARTEVRRSEEALGHLGVTNKEDPTGESGETVPAKAPFAGVVLEKKVTAGSSTVPGSPLFVISDLSILWALAEIDETRLGVVRPGRPAGLHLAAWPGEEFAGKVTFVGDAVNPKTRRVPVRVVVPNPQGRLKPEMFARVTFGEEEPRKKLVVPVSAVQEMEGKSYVFVAGGNGRFDRREVSVGGTEGDLVEVRTGLKEGERVAAQGSFLLKSEMLKASASAEN